MSRPGPAIVISCEHGGRRVPREYAARFRGREGILSTHRGWDPGALVLAREMARTLRAPLFAATVTRLVVDLNRSIGHPRLLSEPMRGLSDAERRRLIARYYLPHRRAVEAAVERGTARSGRVVHVSVHSFTPVLRGERRRADVGLLYDPGRPAERRLCAVWRPALIARRPSLRVRANYPYLGTSDGLTTQLRAIFGASLYVGIELEVNQRFARLWGSHWAALRTQLIASLRESLAPEALGRGPDT